MASELWQRIRAVRKQMQLNQEDFGDLFKVSKAAVSQWESATPKNRTSPEMAKLTEMSRVSGAPISWLLSDDANCDYEYWKDDETPQDKPKEAIATPTQPTETFTEASAMHAAEDQESIRTRQLPIGALTQGAIEFTLSKYLPRGWEVYTEQRMFDLLVYDPDENIRAAIEVKVMFTLSGRTMSSDIDRLIGRLWKIKYMQGGLPKPGPDPLTYLIISLYDGRDRFATNLDFVEEYGNDLHRTLNAAKDHGLIEDYAVVSTRRNDINGIDLYDEVKGPKGRQTLMNLAKTISKSS